MTTTQLARVLGMPLSTISTYCSEGRIHAVQGSNRRYNVPDAEVGRLVRERIEQGATVHAQSREEKAEQTHVEAIIAAADGCSQAQLGYAIRRLCERLEAEEWARHTGYVATRQTLTQRRGKG